MYIHCNGYEIFRAQTCQIDKIKLIELFLLKAFFFIKILELWSLSHKFTVPDFPADDPPASELPTQEGQEHQMEYWLQGLSYGPILALDTTDE